MMTNACKRRAEGGEPSPTRLGLTERARQGWIGSEVVDELADTLDLIAELEQLGAISQPYATRLIRDLAEEQAALWADDHALPSLGVC